MDATQDMSVPDIGDFHDIPVIEVLVKPGDVIALETPIVTLESDKATLDVPSSVVGRVSAIHVSPGTRVSKGTLLLSVLSTAAVVIGASEKVVGRGAPISCS